MIYLDRITKTLTAFTGLVVLLLVLGCSPSVASTATGQALVQGTSEASSVNGVINFQDTEAGLLINAELTAASPGEHGFHIHEFGSCAEAGNAAGSHYNPDGVAHGYLPEDGFNSAHAGDLGNITVAENGTATYSTTLEGLSLTGGKYPIAGRAMIIHEKPDDFGQPVGNAGGRIGCGTIVLVAPTGSN